MGGAKHSSARRRAFHVRAGKRALPKTERQRLRQWAHDQIDGFMRTVGIDPALYTDTDGWRWFEFGSARGFAFVDEFAGEVFLQVAAEVMPLPADRELIVPLMRELLELNANVWGAARFGIRNRRIYACVSAAVADLHAGDVGVFINEVMALADTVDDGLIEKYGGTSKARR